ncbi:hypothetical protein B0H14DRAFT_3688425 [Mycena olivaceomarginata]|nr:hypothetical protein B0H14DRAFT_3688425 [Mycena olivaceomarginata]
MPLQDQLSDLQSRTRISHAGMLSIDELLDPPDEREIGQALRALPAEEAVARGDLMDVDEDGDRSDAEEAPELTCKAIMDLGRTLEENLQQFRGQIQKEQTANAKQVTLAEAWRKSSTLSSAISSWDGLTVSSCRVLTFQLSIRRQEKCSRKKVELSGVNGHFGIVTAIAAQELCRKPKNDVKNDAHYDGVQTLPAPADTSPNEFLDRILNGNVEISNDELPSFLWAHGSFDPDNYDKGLLRGELLFRVIRHIWTAPSSAILGPEDEIPAVCQARIHGKYKMTPEMIGCGAVQVRTMLSTKDWGGRDGAFNYETLHDQVVALLSGLPGWYSVTLLLRARKVEHPRLHPMLLAQYWRNARLDRPHPSPHLPPPLLDTLCFLDSKSPRTYGADLSQIVIIILCTRQYNLAVLQTSTDLSHRILGTRAHVIVFWHLTRSLLPLASTTTTHHDIELKQTATIIFINHGSMCIKHYQNEYILSMATLVGCEKLNTSNGERKQALEPPCEASNASQTHPGLERP